MSSSIRDQVRAAQERQKSAQGGVTAGPITQCEASSATLRFRLVDEFGAPLAAIPYKTNETGSTPRDLHIQDGSTDPQGLTAVVSEIEGESIDFYVVWAELEVDLLSHQTT
jgi:hypothetical protein